MPFCRDSSYLPASQQPPFPRPSHSGRVPKQVPKPCPILVPVSPAPQQAHQSSWVAHSPHRHPEKPRASSLAEGGVSVGRLPVLRGPSEQLVLQRDAWLVLQPAIAREMSQGQGLGWECSLRAVYRKEQVGRGQLNERIDENNVLVMWNRSDRQNIQVALRGDILDQPYDGVGQD